MHAFGDVGRDVGLIAFQHYWLRARQMGIAAGLDRYALNELAARAGRMHRGGPITAPAIPSMPYAFHFDASLFAGLLRRFADERHKSEEHTSELQSLMRNSIAVFCLKK